MTYTEDEMNNAPADSYMGHERDLADLLTDNTLDWYETQTHDYDENYTAWALFTMLMMNYDAARALTDVDEAEQDLAELIQACQDDARDDSGEIFQARIEQRLAMRKTLRNLTESFHRHTKED